MRTQQNFSMHLMPNSLDAAVAELSTLGITVIGLALPLHSSRDEARLCIREAILLVTSRVFHVEADVVRVVSEKGRAPHIEVVQGSHTRRLFLSISHDGNLAFAAISEAQPIGLDVVKIDQQFDWCDTSLLYLGEAEHASLCAIPENCQHQRFFWRWASLEAGLKCLGLPLQEWSEPLSQALSQCEVVDVGLEELPDQGVLETYLCALAFRRNDKHIPAYCR